MTVHNERPTSLPARPWDPAHLLDRRSRPAGELPREPVRPGSKRSYGHLHLQFHRFAATYRNYACDRRGLTLQLVLAVGVLVCLECGPHQCCRLRSFSSGAVFGVDLTFGSIIPERFAMVILTVACGWLTLEILAGARLLENVRQLPARRRNLPLPLFP